MKVLKEKWKGLKNGYDNKVWNIDKVIEAFKTQEVLIEFIRYKLETKETCIDLPIAIGKKLKYQDRAFLEASPIDIKQDLHIKMNLWIYWKWLQINTNRHMGHM